MKKRALESPAVSLLRLVSNPFPKLIVKEVTDGTVLSERTHKLFLFAETGELFQDATAEQIRYAARAINQHEAMVAALTFVVNREHLMFAECCDAEEIVAVCKAALLAEEVADE